MPLKINKYLFGTILNYLLTTIYFKDQSLLVVALFFICMLLNHYFLILFGLKLLKLKTFKWNIPAWFYAVIKITLLVAGFYMALSTLGKNSIYVLITYIFQLIILVISIKRVVKKN